MEKVVLGTEDQNENEKENVEKPLPPSDDKEVGVKKKKIE